MPKRSPGSTMLASPKLRPRAPGAAPIALQLHPLRTEVEAARSNPIDEWHHGKTRYVERIVTCIRRHRPQNILAPPSELADRAAPARIESEPGGPVFQLQETRIGFHAGQVGNSLFSRMRAPLAPDPTGPFSQHICLEW